MSATAACWCKAEQPCSEAYRYSGPVTRLGRLVSSAAGIEPAGVGRALGPKPSSGQAQVALPRSFDDCHTHPGMNTALKKMFALGQIRDLQLAALKDTSPGHRDVLKAGGTFGNRRLSYPSSDRSRPIRPALHSFRTAIAQLRTEARMPHKQVTPAGQSCCVRNSSHPWLP